MKTLSALALSLVAPIALAQPARGTRDWFRAHQDDLIDAAMIAIACLVAVVVVRLMWKALAR
jgi:hypothetical protein